MRRIIVLDTGVLGRVTNPRATVQNDLCNLWLENLLSSDATVAIPEIVDYELRREFLLRNRVRSLRELNALRSRTLYIPITTQIMLLAAEFWAQARRQGRPTADDKALDGDVILAAQASLLSNLGDKVVVATTNVKHLSLFVDARLWQDIPAVAQ